MISSSELSSKCDVSIFEVGVKFVCVLPPWGPVELLRTGSTSADEVLPFLERIVPPAQQPPPLSRARSLISSSDDTSFVSTRFVATIFGSFAQKKRWDRIDSEV